MKLIWTSVLVVGFLSASTLALHYPTDSSSEVTPTRSECTLSSECPLNKACINQNCENPCVGLNVRNTICEVIKHTAIFSCTSNFTGDPFSKCLPLSMKQTETAKVQTKENQVIDSQEDHMIDGYELCETNEDCATDRHCLGKKCVHPCYSTDCYEKLGKNSYCKAVEHKACCLYAPIYY